jgi:hypothetical protein
LLLCLDSIQSLNLYGTDGIVILRADSMGTQISCLHHLQADPNVRIDEVR